MFYLLFVLAICIFIFVMYYISYRNNRPTKNSKYVYLKFKEYIKYKNKLCNTEGFYFNINTKSISYKGEKNSPSISEQIYYPVINLEYCNYDVYFNYIEYLKYNFYYNKNRKMLYKKQKLINEKITIEKNKVDTEFFNLKFYKFGLNMSDKEININTNIDLLNKK